MNVCIIGGGNIGTGIAACAAKNGHRVRIFASRPAEFQPVLRATDPTTGEGFSAAIDFATNDLKRALSGADVICGIYPSFMIWDIFLQIRDTLVAPSRIGVFPGTGGAEIFAGPLLESGHTSFGLDRVPGGYAPAFTSRYFTEDVPFGLCVLKGFAYALGLPTPCMDEVIRWSQKMMNKRYIAADGTPDVDFSETAAPQTFGINSKEAICRYYQRLPETPLSENRT